LTLSHKGAGQIEREREILMRGAGATRTRFLTTLSLSLTPIATSPKSMEPPMKLAMSEVEKPRMTLVLTAAVMWRPTCPR
jgi:hypothetical protein